MSGEDIARVIAALRAVDRGDPEQSHFEAEEVLLAAICAHAGEGEERELRAAWDAIPKWYA